MSSRGGASPRDGSTRDEARSELVLGKLQLLITRKLDGLLQGDYLGLLPGPGTEPGESREYRPGDDVRRMDWPVTARTTVAHVRQTVADRELETWIAVDLSASLDFGTARCLKRDLAVAATAAVAHLTVRGGNRVGAVVGTGSHVRRLPARPGRKEAQGLLRAVGHTEVRPGRADLGALVDMLNRPPRRRGLAVVISDFLVPVEQWERPLRKLGVRHDLLAVEIVDPRELELPNIGVIAFLDPKWLLAIVPVLVLAGVYVWRQLRRRAFAMRFTNVELLRTLAPRGVGPRRHLAAGAFLASLVVLALGLARPSVDAKEPLERATVMLAIDVSLSMRSTDVPPTRIDAAKQAAIDFVKQLPPSFNVGLVAFAKSANVLVSPSKERAAIQQAIDSLQLAEATATGEAVFTCLDAIRSVPADGAEGPPPARVVLLSDGFRTFGRSIEDAAAAAAAANVPVSTIAFGTDTGTVEIDGQLQRVPVDRPSLQKLAEQTKGHFYEAATLGELKKVYQDMGSSIGYRTKPREVTQWYVGVAMLFALAAAGLSLLWTSRLP